MTVYYVYYSDGEKRDACPKCQSTEIWQESANVGVGVIFGPMGCAQCGWSEAEAYDLSDGRSPVDEKGGVIDQYGGYHRPGSLVARAHRLTEESPCE